MSATPQRLQMDGPKSPRRSTSQSSTDSKHGLRSRNPFDTWGGLGSKASEGTPVSLSEYTSYNPVTVIFCHQVEEKNYDPFRVWHRGIIGEAKNFSGYMGVTVLEPSGKDGYFIVIMKFASPVEAETFRVSEEREKWILQLEEDRLVKKPFHAQSMMDDHPFITLPQEVECHVGDQLSGKGRVNVVKKGRKPPAEWKMITLTIIGVYGLVMGWGTFFAMFVPGFLTWSPWLSTFVVVVLVVVCVAKIYMPLALKITGKLHLV